MITLMLIGTISVVSFVSFSNRTLFAKLLFNPYQIQHQKQWYRFVSHAFIHANWEHLIFNMITLYFFGTGVESVLNYVFGKLGGVIFLIMFLLATVVSSVPSYFKHRGSYVYNAVGASGAVSAVLFAFILFEPLGRIYFFFIPIGIPAFVFGILYLIYSAYMAKRNIDNIGHDAHFWGAVFGFIFPILLESGFLSSFVYQLTH